MSYCDGLIAKAISDISCSNPSVKGLERRAIIINREDIDFTSVTFDTTKKNVLTALALKSGKSGFEVVQKGPNPFTGTNQSANVGAYGTGVNRNLVIALLNNDQETSEDVIDSMLNGEFVAVVEYKDKGAGRASAFRVLGLHNGLVLSAYEHDPYGDTYAGGLVTLTETDAPMSAVYLGKTYADGKTLFDSLLEEAE